MAVLPASVQIKALKQREAVQEIHSANQDFIRWECGALGLWANISGCVHHPYRIIHYNVAGCITAHSLFLCLSEMGLFFNLHDMSLKNCGSENWMSTFYLMNNLIKMFYFLFSRTLQPIFSEPVEEVLTYKALRSASADIQTHAQHILLLIWNHSIIKICWIFGSKNNLKCDPCPSGGLGAASTRDPSSCHTQPTASCVDRMFTLWLPSWTCSITGLTCR